MSHPKRQRTLILILSLIAVILAAALLVMNAAYAVKTRKAQQAEVPGTPGPTAADSAPTLTPEPAATPAPTPEAAEPTASAEPETPAPITPPPIQEDFLSLYETNPHIIGWLKAGGFVDQAVVKYDNDFYLSHNFDGVYDENGALFVNAYNYLFPRDDVILIHGHNMATGAMFGLLPQYMSFDYLCRNPVISFRTIYDEEDVFYTPISAFNASMIPSHAEFFDLIRFTFADDPPEEGQTGRHSTEYEDYLREVRELSLWTPKTEVSVEDSLLILVTCSYYQPDGRFMLVCRALRPDETPESVQLLYSSGSAY